MQLNDAVTACSPLKVNLSLSCSACLHATGSSHSSTHWIHDGEGGQATMKQACALSTNRRGHSSQDCDLSVKLPTKCVCKSKPARALLDRTGSNCHACTKGQRSIFCAELNTLPLLNHKKRPSSEDNWQSDLRSSRRLTLQLVPK